jgi:hypothetical protein
MDVKVNIEKSIEEIATFSAEVPVELEGDEPASFEVSVTVSSVDDGRLRYTLTHDEVLFPDEAQAMFAVLGQALQWRPSE